MLKDLYLVYRYLYGLERFHYFVSEKISNSFEWVC